MKLDPWYPEQVLEQLACILLFAAMPVSMFLVGIVVFGEPTTMPTTESPGRIYWTGDNMLVQEITKVHTDGNGEVIKEEVFLEYVGVLPPEKQIRLRSHDTVELVKDLSVPGAKLRK